MLDIPCVIFAGGKSSRMKEDKSLLSFGGLDTLTQFQLYRLEKLFKTVYISCKNKNKFNFEASFIQDLKNDDIFAPTAGFISVFNTLHVDSFFVISVDSPFINENEINKIIEADTPNLDATIAKTVFGIEPLCGIYHRSLENKFIDMSKNNSHKLEFLLESSKTKYIDFKDEKPFLNLNYPHEYQEALKFL